MTSWKRTVALAVFMVVVLVVAACSNKQKRAGDCAPSVKRTQQYFTALCRAWRASIGDEGKRLAKVRLAPSNLPPAKTLPEGPWAILGKGRLVVGRKVSAVWARYWHVPPGTKAVKANAGPKSAQPAGLGHEEKPGDVKIAASKGKGMLRVLSRLDDKKLGSMFDTGAAAAPAGAVPKGALGGTVIDEDPGLAIVNALAGLHRSPRLAVLRVAIAADTPAREVVAFLDLAERADYRKVAFLVAPGQVPRGPAFPGQAKLAPEGGQGWVSPSPARIKQVATPWRDKGCAEVPKLLDTFGKAGRFDDCDRISRAVKRAITRCRCAVSERPILALIHRRVMPLTFVAVHQVTLAPEARAVHIKDGAQPWSKLLPRVLKLDAGKLRLSGFKVSALKSLGGKSDSGQGPRVLIGQVIVSGGLDAATVKRVVRQHLVEIKYCYQSVGLPAHPRLKGDVKMAWTITASGMAGKVAISASTLRHGSTETCLKRSVRRWRYPKPEGVNLPSVTCSFLFRP